MKKQSSFLKRVLALILFSIMSTATSAQALNALGSSGVMGGGSCPDLRVPYTPKTNLQFIDMFQPHHMMAVEMAKEQIERGANAELRALAQRIVQAQMEEIAILKSIRKQLTGNPHSPMMKDPHMDKDMMMLKSLSGATLDLAFIDHMIPHHASGIPSAHRSLAHLTRSELKAMAINIISSQAREIGEMQSLRDRIQ